jgi:O-antigen/teichoic acid export membrane protein
MPRSQWLKHAFFTLTEHGAVRVLDAVMTLVLIRVLSAKDFGLFSVYQSWAGLALLALPSLDLALYRDYGKLKAEGRLNDELAIYRTFNFAKIGVAVALIAVLSLIPQNATLATRFSLLALALAIPLSQALFGFLREPLRFEMRQKLVALLSALQRLALLAALLASARFFPGDTVVLMLSVVVVYALFGVIWALPSKSHGLVEPRQAWRKIVAVLGTTVLWIHVNGVILQSVQTLDTFFLNVFRTPLEDIGIYSIALKSANFFQAIPVALVNVFGVYLARKASETDQARERAIVVRAMLAFAALCCGLFGLGLLIEAPLLKFVGKTKIDGANLAEAILYFRWQLAGILLLAASHPLTTYFTARASLRAQFFKIFLPWIVASCATYALAASLGPMATAKANVVVYSIFIVLLAVNLKLQR